MDAMYDCNEGVKMDPTIGLNKEQAELKVGTGCLAIANRFKVV